MSSPLPLAPASCPRSWVPFSPETQYVHFVNSQGCLFAGDLFFSFCFRLLFVFSYPFFFWRFPGFSVPVFTISQYFCLNFVNSQGCFSPFFWKLFFSGDDFYDFSPLSSSVAWIRTASGTINRHFSLFPWMWFLRWDNAWDVTNIRGQKKEKKKKPDGYTLPF